MRMQLTEAEAAVITRMREIEDAHRGGWNKAIDKLEQLFNENKITEWTFSELRKENRP